MDNAWQTILDLKNTNNPNVIELEQAMMVYLHHMNTEQIHKDAGYSTRLPRYNLYQQQSLQHLMEHQQARIHQVNALKKRIRQVEEDIQRTCEHVWEKDWNNRDDRSHYDCKKCGKFR